MKPRVACPAGLADTAESAPSRPLRSAAPVRTHSRVGAMCWHPPLHCVSCLGIITRPPHHLQWLPNKPRMRCLHATKLHQSLSLCSARACTLALPSMAKR
jgi:hypothetical protein